MLTLFVLGGALIVLFLLAFVMKRRFGVLGLALAAGSLLSTYWSDAVQAFLEEQGITLVQPPLAGVVAVSLALLPALLLLFGGPVYSSKFQRILGGLLFATMAFLVVLPSLTTVFVIDPAVRPVIDSIAEYKNSILAALIVYATIDTMLAQGKSPGRAAGKKKEH